MKTYKSFSIKLIYKSISETLKQSLKFLTQTVNKEIYTWIFKILTIIQLTSSSSVLVFV